MITCTKIVIEVDDNNQGLCSTKCSGYNNMVATDTTRKCKWFHQSIVDGKRCASCLEPDVYDEDVTAWLQEMDADPLTKDGRKRFCNRITGATITKANWMIREDIMILDVQLTDGTNRSIHINSENIRACKRRDTTLSIYWRPWI